MTAAFFFAVASPGMVEAQTQQDMNQQAGQAFASADAALNRVYDRLMAKVSPAGQQSLRQAQRAWITFRDEDCEFETLGSRDGSIHPMVLSECKARLTRTRTRQLQAQIDCPEGDAGCGGQ